MASPAPSPGPSMWLSQPALGVGWPRDWSPHLLTARVCSLDSKVQAQLAQGTTGPAPRPTGSVSPHAEPALHVPEVCAQPGPG